MEKVHQHGLCTTGRRLCFYAIAIVDELFRLENLNREFRRRTKTQASFSTEAAALTVLFGLVAVGQIVFRKIDGHQDLAAFLRQEQWYQAA